MTFLRRIARDIADGFHAGWQVLMYGWPYPRHLSADQLSEMRTAAQPGPGSSA